MSIRPGAEAMTLCYPLMLVLLLTLAACQVPLR